MRIGIGKPQNKTPNPQNLAQDLACESQNLPQISIIDFVLSDFSDDELKALQPTFEIVANALDSFINGANIQALQNRYTKKN